MKALLATVALLAVVNAEALAQLRGCGSGTGCGPEFVAKGWTQIAYCAGHNWSYLLQKSGRIIYCKGVSGRAGPVEFPCQEFKGNLEEYRVMAAKSVTEPVGCWLSSAEIGEVVK